MNKDIIEGKWKEIKGDLRKAWGNLTDDELEQSKGDATALAGVLQKRYGFAKEDAQKKISEVFSRYASNAREELDRKDNEERH